MCEKLNSTVDKCNDWILFVFLGSLYGRTAIDGSWKSVKISHIVKCERLLFLPPIPGIQSLFSFLPCHVLHADQPFRRAGTLGTGWTCLGLCTGIRIGYSFFKCYRFLEIPVCRRSWSTVSGLKQEQLQNSVRPTLFLKWQHSLVHPAVLP